MNKKQDEYNALLRTPQWQRKKCEVLMRDNFTCQICGETSKFLHVHHWEYRHLEGRKPWEYEMDNFITLCEDCHGVRHDEGFLKFIRDVKKLTDSNLAEAVHQKEMEWSKCDDLAWTEEHKEYISGEKTPDEDTRYNMNLHEKYGYLRKLSSDEISILLPYIQKYLIHFHEGRNKEEWTGMVEHGYLKNCLSGNEIGVLNAMHTDYNIETEVANMAACYNWDVRNIWQLFIDLERYCVVNEYNNLAHNIQIAANIIWDINKNIP